MTPAGLIDGMPVRSAEGLPEVDTAVSVPNRRRNKSLVLDTHPRLGVTINANAACRINRMVSPAQ